MDTVNKQQIFSPETSPTLLQVINTPLKDGANHCLIPPEECGVAIEMTDCQQVVPVLFRPILLDKEAGINPVLGIATSPVREAKPPQRPALTFYIGQLLRSSGTL